jgi:separase
MRTRADGGALAGCPAVVANLWDVTDRDIDRFCQAVLKDWVEGGRGGGAQGGDGGGGDPGGVGGEGGTGAAGSVSGAVARSRAACRLPHLIGAAPVCYGLPTAVGWRRAVGA